VHHVFAFARFDGLFLVVAGCLCRGPIRAIFFRGPTFGDASIGILDVGVFIASLLAAEQVH
jgi:hypothetical protein